MSLEQCIVIITIVNQLIIFITNFIKGVLSHSAKP